VKPSDFLVQIFGKNIDGRLIEGAVFPEVECREGLV
jgi:hypothetical protein